jgi:chemotaxis protein MotB
VALVALLVPGVGCVSSGKYREVEGERDRLQERVEQLEVSSTSLDAERARLADQMEDLREKQAQLDRDLARLRKSEAELSTSLAAREAELDQRNREVLELRSTYQGLVSDLEAEVAAGQIEIEQLREGLRLNLSEDVLFPSGSAEINPQGREVLGKVAERVKSVPHRVVVQGHTDDVPIATARFPSNWELAGARASRVVRLLAEKGVDPTRLSAVSLSEYQPRAPNDTPEGRARNRRIEITLQPVRAAGAEAEAEPAATP